MKGGAEKRNEVQIGDRALAARHFFAMLRDDTKLKGLFGV
jgi:hypothetical protein